MSDRLEMSACLYVIGLVVGFIVWTQEDCELGSVVWWPIVAVKWLGRSLVAAVRS